MPGVVLVEVERSGFIEGVHHGSVVVLGTGGELIAEAGSRGPVFPRSSNKPLQAVGMLRAGLRLEPPELALAAASHSGESFQVRRILAMLAAGGLTEDDLACPADLPSDPAAIYEVLSAGGGPTRSAMNCSGKHAAMLRACLVAGWPTRGYLKPEHPLQKSMRTTVEELAGELIERDGIDGCGAPLFGLTLAGLARAFIRLVESEPGTPERLVADAMRAYPEFVGGTGRDVTRLMTGIPGLLAKDGYEGVYVAAVPGAGAVALKIEDGAARARTPVLVSGLRRLGLTGEGTQTRLLDELAELPLMGGGVRVGVVRSRW